jgi:2-polyprenyl-6-methoxyphenol hydroxylase-like FAD-dependent oxidoreductase
VGFLALSHSFGDRSQIRIARGGTLSGSSRLHISCRFTAFEERVDHVVGQFVRRGDGQRLHAIGDALIGCDGIHSAVRAALYPREHPPVWNGITVWRGATNWPRLGDGRTMVVAGGLGAKFVQGGPERVIDLVEARAPSGFQNLDAVATYAERKAIVRGHDALAQSTAGDTTRA